ncbi:glycosyltransferase family 39 protein [Sulfurimonas sp.]|uniref:glycosyltransferase family 39 protein n=1 Tax=Sulfurimonas sp. TaxID=2022749 RepID=UPI002AAF5F28|nr:glycosyltransferase family 39 protein [Sulfurimonas sp.]
MKSFSLYSISIAIATLAYGLFIFSYPPSYFNDDSLFLANGILNFSIIDFSPQFPGYPSVIILGKTLNYFIDNHKYSLFILSAGAGILLPLMLFLYVKAIKNEKVAFFTFLLSISSVYLLNISLSMLSESVGLFFFFLSLYLLEIKKHNLSGVFLAIAFFARPSYFVLYLAGLVYLYFYKKDSIKDVLIPFIFTTILFLIFIYLSNGMLYFYEAKRFIIGHFSIWGTGQHSEISWLSRIFIIENLPFIFLIFFFKTFFLKHKEEYLLLYILFLSYLLWILLAQNPDNIRHLVPLIFIATIFLATLLKNQKILLSLLICFNLAYTLSSKAKLSPIEQIISKIKTTDRIIFSNRSINILKNNLNTTVFDNYYVDSSTYYKEHSKYYEITSKKPTKVMYKTFKGRFLGEDNYYLILPYSNKFLFK